MLNAEMMYDYIEHLYSKKHCRLATGLYQPADKRFECIDMC